MKLADWRIHDIRRTGATDLQALGVPIDVTEAILCFQLIHLIALRFRLATTQQFLQSCIPGDGIKF